MSSASDEIMLAALGELRAALERCSTRSATLISGIDDLVTRHRAGKSWRAIAEETDGPTVLEQVNEAVNEVVEASAVLRREAVHQLREQGMTEAQLAARFHISRQRVSQLAHDKK